MVSMVSESSPLNVMRCTIWYHLYNSKNVKNTHGGVLLLVELQAIACNFTKSHTSPWLFFMFFELYKYYQIAQSITNFIFLPCYFVPLFITKTLTPPYEFLSLTGWLHHSTVSIFFLLSFKCN